MFDLNLAPRRICLVVGVTPRRPGKGHLKAFRKKGWPSHENIFKETEGFVIRHADAKANDELSGGSLQVSCCSSSVRNVCRFRLMQSGAELLEMHEHVARTLSFCADKWGKARSNVVRAVLMIETQVPSGPIKHRFALLVRAWFSPKYQLWALCGPTSDAASPPFVLRLMEEPCRVCPRLLGPMVRTGDELAELVARDALGGSFALNEVRYKICEDTDHLRDMLVDGWELIDTSGVAQRRAPTNRPLQELRNLSAPTSQGDGEQRALEAWARGRGSRGGRGRRAGNRGRGAGRRTPRAKGSEGAADMLEDAPIPHADAAREDGPPPPVCPDEVEDDIIDDMDAEDIMEVALAFEGELQAQDKEGCDDEEGAHTSEVMKALQSVPLAEGEVSQSSGNAHGVEPLETRATGHRVVEDEEPPPAVPAQAPHPFAIIAGPSAGGYFIDRRTNRHCARISPVFNSSVSVKCYVHSKCQVAMAEWKLPSREELARWALDAVLPESAAPEEREQATQAHRNLLKALVANAQRPGRRRQDIIAEAEAVPASQAAD